MRFITELGYALFGCQDHVGEGGYRYEKLPFDGKMCMKECVYCGKQRRACYGFRTVEGGAKMGWERNVCEKCGSEDNISMGVNY